MKLNAEQYLVKPSNDAFVAVSTYFDDSQREATKDAGIVLRNINRKFFHLFCLKYILGFLLNLKLLGKQD